MKPKKLNLPKGEIQQRIIKTKTGFKITLKSSILHKDVFLFTDEKGHFSDNLFDLLPNETKVIKFKTDSKSLSDLEIKTLNLINTSC